MSNSSSNDRAFSPETISRAVDNINDYCSSIAGQGDVAVTGLSDFNRWSLNRYKTNAAQWFDTISPAHLNMPDTILSHGNQITADLADLSALSEELTIDDNPQLKQAMADAAGDLAKTLQNLLDRINDLSQSLGNFAVNIDDDRVDCDSRLDNAWTYIQNTISLVSGILGSSGIISSSPSMKQIMDSTKDSVHFTSTFRPLATKAAKAVQSAYLLQTFWTGIAFLIKNGLSNVQNIQDQSAANLSNVFQSAGNIWNNIQSNFEHTD